MQSKNYILIYYQQIKDGSVTVGRWIEKWYEYIVHGLEEKRFFFDQKKAARAIAFIQQYCRHHEGPLAPQLIQLEVWQKAMISVLFGIVDQDGLRQFRESLCVVGRKNGKTLIDAAISAYMMFADGEYGARAFFVASRLDQARLAFEAFYQMISKEPRLARLAKKRRTDVYIAESNSSAMPVAFSERKTDGLNPSYVSLDELASWRGDAGLKQYEVFKSALGARSQPLMFGISTAGYENDGIYDELIRRSTAVLNGTSKETRLAPFLYIIDDPDKWNDIEELKKANPNLGVSTSVDYMLEEIRIAEGSLSKKTEFLTKYCNIKQNSSQAWLTAQDVKKCFSGGIGPEWHKSIRGTDIPNALRLEDFRHTYALGGIDLSMTTDLTAAVAVIEKDGVSYFFTQFFLPKEKIKDATARDGLPYEAYIQRGFLTPSGDKVVDYNDVYNWFLMLQRKYEIYMIKVGYDRYSAQYLVDQMQASGFVMESVSQGSNLTGVLIDMEGMIRDRKLVCANDNDLMKIHMLDAALKMEQGTNRRRMVKITAKAHIDGMAALSDAICMRHNHWASFPQLQNRR